MPSSEQQPWRGKRQRRRAAPAAGSLALAAAIASLAAATAAGADVYLAGCAGLMCQGFTCTSLVLDYQYDCAFLDTMFGCACGAPHLSGSDGGSGGYGEGDADEVVCGLCRWQNYTRDICSDDELFRGS